MFTGWRSYDPSMAARLANNEFRRRETLKLYREVIRVCRAFTWTDPQSGLQWGEIIRAAAREEIESSREEKDPEILARALMNAQFALDELVQKYKAKQQEKQHEQLLKDTQGGRIINQSNEMRAATPRIIVPKTRIILPYDATEKKEE